MDDLISRKAAIEEFENMVTSVSVYGESAEARYATNARIRFIEKLNSIPTVPAVPLDKLCEWLEMYAMMNCDGCREGFGSCEDEENQEVSVCNSRERWKAMLTKWMEEQDAKEET